VSERAELGEGSEALFGVTIPEAKGAFLDFCTVLGSRAVTEFSYRVGETDEPAKIFVGVQLKGGHQERESILTDLAAAGYGVVDLSEEELPKQHVRYLLGCQPPHVLTESVFSCEFAEHPGALIRLLEVPGSRRNV